MIRYHVTIAKYIPSILETGLRGSARRWLYSFACLEDASWWDPKNPIIVEFEHPARFYTDPHSTPHPAPPNNIRGIYCLTNL